MHLVEVMPITRSVLKDSLSYFSSKALPEGSFVYVTVRKSQIPAIVIASRPVEHAKSEIKQLPYTLKKLDSEDARTLFSKAFIESARRAADYFASTTGSVIDTLTPQKILQSIEDVEHAPSEKASEKSIEKIDGEKNDQHVETKTEHLHAPETYVLQSDDDERYSYYKSLIRESFAKKKSVFLCVPTIEDAVTLGHLLEKGIEDYTIILHGSLTKKATLHAWNKALTEAHAMLIIATGTFLSLPRQDLGALVIEKESSRSYKTLKRPYLDIRTFAEMYAARLGIRLIYGDQLLRIETAWRYRNGDLIEAAPIKWRSLTTAQTSLVDMKQYVIKNEVTQESKSQFRLFSDETVALIESTKRNSERMYIYVGRRGLAPSVVCNDCGTTVRCNACKAPVVLHGGLAGPVESAENFLLCHRCGVRRSALEACSSCTSWNLTTLGIGSEQVEKALRKQFPYITFFKIDYDSVKTHAAAEKIITAFYNTPGSIMIGTEMALLYLREKIEHAAVITMDSMFSIPDFRINEKVLGTILKIRSLAYKNVVVQTRQVEQKVWDHALKGNLIEFYREEITERERFGYPPFTTLIKITFEGKRDDVVNAMKHLKTHIMPWKLAVFPAFLESSDRQYVLHGLIKLATHEWINLELLMKLRALPPTYSIKIDPENLL